MSTLLCPMLSALKPEDEDGRPVDRECIYEQCRFFNVDEKDCNLMMASSAMLRMADDASRTAQPDGAQPSGFVEVEKRIEDIEKRFEEVGGELRRAVEKLQESVHESSDTLTERVTSVVAGQEALESSVLKRVDERGREDVDLPARLEDSSQRVTEHIDRRLDETARTVMEQIDRRLEESMRGIVDPVSERLDRFARDLSDKLEHRLGELEKMVAESVAPLRTALDEQGVTLTTRLDDAMRTLSEMATSSAQLKGQLDEVLDMQRKAAEKVLEEISLVGATLQKLEHVAANTDGKLDAFASEGINLAQVLTLVKGDTERTYAALRKINEGNQSVLDAMQAQLQRDQEELKHKRRDEAQNLNNRGVVLYYRGALEAAVGSFRQSVHLNPEYSEAYNNLGLALSKLGRGEEAVEAFQNALKIDPKMGEVFNNLGFLYHTSAQFERAVEMFGQAIENAADTSIAYTNLGNSYYKLQQPDQALGAWKRALELDPMNENARRGLRMFQQDGAGARESAA